MSPPAALTLDATGTLMHAPRLGEIYSEVLARHGLVLEPDAVRATFRTVWQELGCRVPAGVDRFTSHPEGPIGFWHELISRLCALNGLDRPSRFATAELYDRFVRADAWQVFPEVVPTLDRLAELGVRMAVVSNWDPRLPTLLEHLGLARRFETIVISSHAGVAKPHAKIFRDAIAALGTAPQDALHVGDSQREDVEGALAIGMQARRLDRSGRVPDALRDLEPLVAVFAPPTPTRA